MPSGLLPGDGVENGAEPSGEEGALGRLLGWTQSLVEFVQDGVRVAWPLSKEELRLARSSGLQRPCGTVLAAGPSKPVQAFSAVWRR